MNMYETSIHLQGQTTSGFLKVADEIGIAGVLTGTFPTSGEKQRAEDVTGKSPLVKVNETICLVGPCGER